MNFQIKNNAMKNINSFANESDILLKKNQDIVGTIMDVSDNISIKIAGRTVKVPNNAITDPVKGENRDFKVIDIKEDKILLKEMNQSATFAKSMSGETDIAYETYDNTKELKSDKSNNKNTVSTEEVISGLDETLKKLSYKILIISPLELMKLEQFGNSIDEMGMEEISKALDDIYKQSDKNSDNMKYNENYQDKKDYKVEIVSKSVDNQAINVDKTQEEYGNCGTSGQKVDNIIDKNKKMSEIIENELNKTGIVYGYDTISEISNTVTTIIDKFNIETASEEMDATFTLFDDKTMKYLLKNELAPNLNNIYISKFSGMSENSDSVNDENIAKINEQIEKVVQSSGLEISEESMSNAKWLLKNNIPLTPQNMEKMCQIMDLKECSLSGLVGKVINSFKEGIDVNQYDLSEVRNYVLAKEALEGISDYAIKKCIFEQKTISIKELDQCQKSIESYQVIFESSGSNENIAGLSSEMLTDEVDLKSISVRRQLEEIRVMMSNESSRQLENKGINLFTDDINNVVLELKKIESSFINNQVNEQQDKVELVYETRNTISSLKSAPAYVLGSTLSAADSISLKEVYTQGILIKQSLLEGTYETLMTRPSKEYGDSLTKAFNNTESLLNEMGMDITEQNKRAVRILGYNQMEITTETVEEIKSYDVKMNYLLSNMTPANILNLVKNNINPLQESVNSLSNKLEKMNKENSVISDNNYAKFLWNLDQKQELTGDQREAYIGVFRLIKAINKSDGSAIGATIKSGKEFTLNNILTSLKSMKNTGKEYEINDDFGSLEGLIKEKKSIEEQINTSTGSKEAQVDPDVLKDTSQKNMKDGNYEIVSKMLMEIEKNFMADESISPDSLMNVTIESLYENALQKESIQDQNYYERKLIELKKAISTGTQAKEILEQLGEKPTISAIVSANSISSGEGISQIIRKIVKNDMQNGNAKKINSDITKRSEDNKDLENEIDPIEERADEIVERLKQLETSISRKDEFVEQFTKICDYISDTLDITQNSVEMTGENLALLKQYGSTVSMTLNLTNKETYDIPILINDEITNVHLTIVNENSKKANVFVKMETENLGKVSADFTIKDDGIKGLVTCSTLEGTEALEEEKVTFMKSLAEQGVTISGVDYFCSDAKMRNNSSSKDRVEFGQSEKLYIVAKEMIASIKQAEGRIKDTATL